MAFHVMGYDNHTELSPLTVAEFAELQRILRVGTQEGLDAFVKRITPVGGIGDRFIDKQKARIIRDTFTTEHAVLALDRALAKLQERNNPLVALIMPFLTDNKQWAAELMNEFLLAYALGEE